MASVDNRREYYREYYRKNREKIKAKKRTEQWKRRGMDISSISRLEPPACEACGHRQKIALHCDHNHDTGKFRGWLCRGCNRALGLLGESPERVHLLLKYVNGDLRGKA